MNGFSAKTRYHAMMLTEPLTGFPIQDSDREAFARNFRVRVAETGDEIILDAAAKRFQCAICLADVDRNPTPAGLLEESITRLWLLIPIGKELRYGSLPYHDFIAELHEELGYHWRRRLEGLSLVEREQLWAENADA